jgi:ABC-type phosphate transport system auxiliary subunit
MSTQIATLPGYGTGASYAPVMEMAQAVIEERDAELAALRERLAYYEAFDTLINDNVSRSAELFRPVNEERERLRAEAARWHAAAEAAGAQEAERRLAAERSRTQTILMSLMDEATGMQRQIDSIIQRIAEAITESTVRLPEANNEPTS